MKYQVACSIPGRLRVRFGVRAFTRTQAAAVERELLKLESVSFAEANPRTGSVLVKLAAGRADEVLRFFDALDFKRLELEESPDESYLLRESTRAFRQAIVTKLACHFGKSVFFPPPLNAVLSLLNYGGYLKKGVKSLAKGKVGVDVLDMVSIGSALATRQFSTASSVILMLSISEMLEDHTRKQTRSALKESLALNVDLAWTYDARGKEVQVPFASLKAGDVVIVRTGTLIPADGTVVAGNAEVNEATMTGESLPRHKREGTTVYAGTIVESGRIDVRISAVSGETRLSKIVNLIDESENFKALLQSRAERVADRIAPFSLAAAAGVLGLTRNSQRAMSVLMVDFSCAIKLSIPIAVISAMREAASHKIAVKGGKFLEAFALADTIVFDKTGTLTAACPTVSRIIPMPGFDEDEVLRLAACLEEHFPHSVARAIVEHARAKDLCHKDELHAKVDYIVAHGISSRINGKHALIGSAHFVFEDSRVPMPAAAKRELKGRAADTSNIFLAINGKLAGILCIEDPPRPEAARTIARLRKLGLKHIVMLTGDGENAARSVARKLGITEYRAQVLPENKASVISDLKAQGRTVIMVGDGINDSPALSCADVSVAMRDASDLAREVADIAMLSNDLGDLAVMREMSQKLFRRIKKTQHGVIGFNSALIALGAAGVLSPGVSAFLHNASTTAFCANASRALLPPR